MTFTLGVLNLVDSDRVDLSEHLVLQPEGDDVFHGVEYLVPMTVAAPNGL